MAYDTERFDKHPVKNTTDALGDGYVCDGAAAPA